MISLMSKQKDGRVLFRADDARLIEALDAYADSVRRSRNMAINLLLEEILTQHGFWPPEEEDEPPEGSKRRPKK
jgi:hypothetical protein